MSKLLLITVMLNNYTKIGIYATSLIILDLYSKGLIITIMRFI